jgi:hypothetical protein
MVFTFLFIYIYIITSQKYIYDIIMKRGVSSKAITPLNSISASTTLPECSAKIYVLLNTFILLSRSLLISVLSFTLSLSSHT